MAYTLEQLNAATTDEAVAMLDGLYEHSPWIARQALASRPFRSLPQLQDALRRVLDEADAEAGLALIRAHPELAGRAMQDNSLTAESTHEQDKAGLTHCSPEELARLRQLNADYLARFGFPFILAVRGPRGIGLTRGQIIATFERRLDNPPDVEFREALRNIHRIVEIRLADKFGLDLTLGNDIWDWHERLSVHSDPGYAEQGQLTVTYLTDAHRACAQRISHWMRDCGFDEVEIDAVGNVVGRYRAERADAATLMTGSHYDTVRNGGKVRRPAGHLRAHGLRAGTAPPGPAPALSPGSDRLRRGGRPALRRHLPGLGRAGRRLQAGMAGPARRPGHHDARSHAARRPVHRRHPHAAARSRALPGFRRSAHRTRPGAVRDGPAAGRGHLDQRQRALPGPHRRHGQPCRHHPWTAGATRRRHGRAGPVSGTARGARRRSVGTMGMLDVPNGSINVVPGECRFSLDLRAPGNAQRDALATDVLAELAAICQRRGLRCELEETLRAAAAPSAPAWQARWERAVEALGLPVHRMPSGAGHDAMKLHEAMPQAMLFVRGQNFGISHNPLESTTANDMQLAAQACATCSMRWRMR